MKTSELTGVALDWAVAKCEGLPKAVDSSGLDGPVIVCGFEQEMLHSQHRKGQEWKAYKPLTNWAQGGPIIEREMIDLKCLPTKQGGFIWRTACADGPTPLIAAMRCYVASKLGDDIEIPEELNV
jgi:hypothetical protein